MEYGYGSRKVPTCHMCAALVKGELMLLRRPRQVALTRTSRDADAAKAKRRACPPLSARLVRKRKFEVSFMKLAGWRPVNDNTSLIFAVSLWSVNRQKSTFFASDVTPNTKTNLFRDGRFVGDGRAVTPVNEDSEDDESAKKNGSQSRPVGQRSASIPIDSLMSSHRFSAGNTPTERDDDGGGILAASPLPKRAIGGGPPARQTALHNNNNNGTGEKKKSDAGLMNSNASLDGSPRPSRPPLATTTHSAGDMQLDVAYSLSLESILRVVMDTHPEGDYITIETYAEIYRLQVTKLVAGAATEEQRVRGEGGDGKFRIGRAPSAPIPAAGGGGGGGGNEPPPPQPASAANRLSSPPRHSTTTDSNREDSGTNNNGGGGNLSSSMSRRIVRSTVSDIKASMVGGGGLTRDHSMVLGGGGGSSLRPSASTRSSKPIDIESSESEEDEFGDAMDSTGAVPRTSRPAKGAVFEACVEETKRLYGELERIVHLLEKKRQARGQ